MAFFQQVDAFGFLIYVHTDSNASDEYNINLSNRRANMVAGIAQDAGTRVVDVRGFGEHRPTATNATSAGRAENWRVKIYCIC
jgi:outer membrane protein OmpA-like peptidoglycan-associated protein